VYYDLQQIEVMDDYNIFLRFEDGKQGVVDLSAIVDSGGVFGPLKDKRLFRQAFIDEQWRVLCWPGDIDIAPETLYAALSETQAAQT